MQWMKNKWIRASVTFCPLLLAAPSQCQHLGTATDSFCELYTKVVVRSGDENIKAPLAVKKRLLINEQLYHATCLGARS